MGHPFYDALTARIEALGGLHNAHTHIDRIGTLDPRYLEVSDPNLTLPQKHALVARLHAGPAYDREDLRTRVNAALDEMIACGTRRVESVVDCTTDRVGLTALETLMQLARDRASEITLSCAAYSPFGFSDADPARWALLKKVAAHADLIGALPEADDITRYPDRIGFEASISRFLDLAARTGKALQIHLDQRNDPGESGTEALIRQMESLPPMQMPDGSPQVWAVHVISPSTYDEARFQKLTEGLLRCNIGVICCPSGALSMRQLRPIQTPTGNSIARVLEFAAAGVPVRLGTDNMADMLSPSSTANLYDELKILSPALRFYDTDILARFATGTALSEDERARLNAHLERDRDDVEAMVAETAHTRP
ncbi:MAG: hypothetical protein AAFQ36_10005 [Pseudomonadota bacterium]